MTAMTMKSTAAPRPGAPTWTPLEPDQPEACRSASPAAAVRQNSVSVVRRTGTPSWRAARRAPPLAKTALPNRVRHSAQVARPVSASHHSSETRNRPSPSCSGRAEHRDGRRPSRARRRARSPAPSRRAPRRRPATSPCRTRNVASVTRKLGSPVLTTRKPLTSAHQQRGGQRRRAGRASVFQPACSISSAVTSELATATTPMERSNWPAMSSRATATPPMPSSAAASPARWPGRRS